MIEFYRYLVVRPTVRYATAPAIVVLAYIVRYALVQGLGLPMPPYITFYPAVIFAAVLGGLWPGMFATALCALVSDFLILPSPNSFRIASSDKVALGLFVVMGVLISLLAEYYRKARLTIAGYKAKQALGLMSAKLELVLASMTDAVLITDLKGELIHFNDAFATFHRFKSKEECFRRASDFHKVLEVYNSGGELVPLDRWATPRALRGEIDTLVDVCHHRKDTGETWMGSYNYAPLRDGSGAIVGSVVVARDVTESKRAEASLRRLNRVYAVLSGINEALVRQNDSRTMLQTACSIAVEKGSFIMAWVGMFNPESGLLEPFVSAGLSDGYLDQVKIDLRDPAKDASPAARAFHSGHHAVCNDIEHELYPLWKRFAATRGYRSLASFPLSIDGKIKGVFNLYASEIGFFDEQEIRLLDEMAMDISFALEVSFHEEKHKQLEAETIAHLRELQVLGEMNKALLAVNSEKDLLQEYCRIAVETAGYRMAWVGFAEETPEKRVVPVAWAGHEDGYLSAVKITWDGGVLSQGPTGRAILFGQIEGAEDFAASPGLNPFHQEAGKRGYESCIAIPFQTDSGAMACLSIYGAEKNLWSESERHLMHQVASALGYGIRTLRGAIAREQYLKELRDSLEHSIQLIADTVDRRDPYTAGHQRRVADLSTRIARELGLEPERIRGLRLAATIHDLGKIGIPAEILAKPGPLSSAEFALLKEHSQIGYDILKEVSFPWPIAEMILQHHEHFDGSGYPRALSGDAILLEARILTVADSLEALATHRPYRASLGIEFALDEILSGRGTLFDASVVDACTQIFREGYSLAE